MLNASQPGLWNSPTAAETARAELRPSTLHRAAENQIFSFISSQQHTSEQLSSAIHMWRPIFDPSRGRGALPQTSSLQEPQNYATSSAKSSRRRIQAPVHILGCNRTTRHIYGDVSANEQADTTTAGGCTAEPSGDIAPCGRFTLPHCNFSTSCTCLQCYLSVC